jgi:prephenate dehydrogenase
LPNGCRFIGSHPIAGSEKTGCEHATADLFDGKQVIITPTDVSATQDVIDLGDFWTSLGAEVSCMTPDEHDEILAYTSHLPHLISTLLAAMMPREPYPYFGSGYKGMTRLAKGDPELWRDIFVTNREHLIEAVGEFQNALNEAKRILFTGNPEFFLQMLTDGNTKAHRQEEELGDRS